MEIAAIVAAAAAVAYKAVAKVKSDNPKPE